jgi:hypothetical protein
MVDGSFDAVDLMGFLVRMGPFFMLRLHDHLKFSSTLGSLAA